MYLHAPAFVRRRPWLHRPLRRLRRRLRRVANGGTGGKAHSPDLRRIHVPLPAPPAAREGSSPPAGLTLVAKAHLRVPRQLAGAGLVGHEPTVIATFLAAIDHADDGSVLDVGANIGLYAALAGAYAGGRPVCAFEPTPELVATARRFVKENGLPVEVEAMALGARNEDATFYLSDTADTSNSLLQGFRRSSHQIEVPVETLDHWCARRNVVPAVLKIDTEATEHDVIRGGTEVIARHRPFILCEVLRGREQPIIDAMGPFGYRWYHISGEVPFQAVDTLSGDPEYRDLMYLFAPEAPDEEFWQSVRAWSERLTRP